MSKAIRILLVRHGESDGNINPLNYIGVGDDKNGLNETGWQQTIANGKFLGNLYTETGTEKPPHVFLSPLLRTQQTTSGIYATLSGLWNGQLKLREEPRLVEKFFGATNHMDLMKKNANLSFIDKLVFSSLWSLSKAVHKNDPFTATNLFGDSSKSKYADVKGFIDGTFSRKLSEGQNDFLIITHGAVIQAFLRSWMHIPLSTKIKNPENCDVILIEGESSNWTVTKIYDGKKMEPVHIDFLNGAKPYSVADLPPVPPQFLQP